VVPPDDHAPEPRSPTVADLVSLCRDLNETGARYIVIGGMAIVQAGFTRTTEGVDLLVDTAPDNIDRLRAALMRLPDGAIRLWPDASMAHSTISSRRRTPLATIECRQLTHKAGSPGRAVLP
jgi:hypothetical protein